MRIADLKCVHDFTRIIPYENSRRKDADSVAGVLARHFDAVFVINVETDTERKRNILQLEDAECDYHYVTAITGADPGAAHYAQHVLRAIAEDPERQKALRWVKYEQLQICLAMSHILVLNYCLERGIKSCLILEDDFLLHKQFADLAQRAFSCLPADWNMLWLGAKQDRAHPAENVNEHWYRPNNFTWGTHAYALRNCIKEVRDQYARFELPIDLQLTHGFSDAQKYVAVPPLIISTCDGRQIGSAGNPVFETYALWNWDVLQYVTSPKKSVDVLNTSHGGPWTLGCAGIGAWPFFIQCLRMLADAENDTAARNLFLDFADREFSWGYRGQPTMRPWLGVIHHPYDLPLNVYGAVKKLLADAPFQAAKPYCQRLFGLSEYLTKQLASDPEIAAEGIPVSTFTHPTNLFEELTLFDPAAFLANPKPMLVSLGGAFRRFITLDKIECPYQKAWAFGMYPDYLRNLAEEFKQAGSVPSRNTNILGRMTYAEYNELLSKNIGFLDVIESSANNAVLDCISRNTPLLAVRHPAVVEYLGYEYPLYFETLAQAHRLANDQGAILAAHEYLTQYDKQPFHFYSALRRLYSEL
jgi:GR25 family glycosyltransferase involved in LPS biosynthesis